MLKPVFEDVTNFNCSDLYLRSVGAPAGNKIISVFFDFNVITLYVLVKYTFHKSRESR